MDWSKEKAYKQVYDAFEFVGRSLHTIYAVNNVLLGNLSDKIMIWNREQTIGDVFKMLVCIKTFFQLSN